MKVSVDERDGIISIIDEKSGGELRLVKASLPGSEYYFLHDLRPDHQPQPPIPLDTKIKLLSRIGCPDALGS